MSGTSLKATNRALVVLVHGFLGGRVQFLPMASMLSKSYDVLNFGYPSRKDTLLGHANALCDAVAQRVEHDKREGLKDQRSGLHFVTHSFGGVVLHRAFAAGLKDILPADTPTRCVLMAPPLRGARLARAFRKDQMVGPELFRSMIHSAAERIMGPGCGAELMTNESEWFEAQLGVVPNDVEILVIAGVYGKINPLIDGESDGIVAVDETMMNRRHIRFHIGLTHNMLLLSREVINCIMTFLDGHSVGEAADGIPNFPREPLTLSKSIQHQVPKKKHPS